jgi:hypothetical protein
MKLDSSKSLNYLQKIPEFYREVVKCWNLSVGVKQNHLSHS